MSFQFSLYLGIVFFSCIPRFKSGGFFKVRICPVSFVPPVFKCFILRLDSPPNLRRESWVRNVYPFIRFWVLDLHIRAFGECFHNWPHGLGFQSIHFLVLLVFFYAPANARTQGRRQRWRQMPALEAMRYPCLRLPRQRKTLPLSGKAGNRKTRPLLAFLTVLSRCEKVSGQGHDE